MSDKTPTKNDMLNCIIDLYRRNRIYAMLETKNFYLYQNHPDDDFDQLRITGTTILGFYKKKLIRHLTKDELVIIISKLLTHPNVSVV